MTPEDIPKLFHEFEQLETGSGRRFEGTGLGLALVKALVELHGGSNSPSRASSDMGPPSRFSSPGAWTHHRKGPAQENRDELMARILIVEDNASNLKLATVILRAAGFHVVGACDSVEAGRASRKLSQTSSSWTWDCRGRTGTPSLGSFGPRGDPRHPDHRGDVVCHGRRPTRAMEAGCVAYLTKPIDRIALVRTISESSSLPKTQRSGRREPRW